MVEVFALIITFFILGMAILVCGAICSDKPEPARKEHRPFYEGELDFKSNVFKRYCTSDKTEEEVLDFIGDHIRSADTQKPLIDALGEAIQFLICTEINGQTVIAYNEYNIRKCQRFLLARLGYICETDIVGFNKIGGFGGRFPKDIKMASEKVYREYLWYYKTLRRNNGAIPRLKYGHTPIHKEDEIVYDIEDGNLLWCNDVPNGFYWDYINFYS